MSLLRRAPVIGARQYVTATKSLATSLGTAQYGRTAAYRRLISTATSERPSSSPLVISSLNSTPFSSSSQLISSTRPVLLRSLHTTRPLYQQTQTKKETEPEQDVRDPPRDQQQSEQKTAGNADEKQQTEGDKDGKEKSEKSDTPPPPPPHGDKTPWQVFAETLRNEFKASKEWNESTKQLSGSVQQFTESDAVRRAREASEAATKGTSQVIKGAGRAIGQGAAWTWDTKVVQGIRQGVNATGRGIEKATRPVRETKAFKDITEAIDDGSSSRYGGWTEKEERRRKREAQLLKEQQSGKKTNEPLVEDPK